MNVSVSINHYPRWFVQYRLNCKQGKVLLIRRILKKLQ